MSQPTTTLSFEECFAILQRWRKDGPTEEERNDFVTRASRLLTDSDTVNEFLNKIGEAEKLARSIGEIMRSLAEIQVSNPPNGWITIIVSPEWDDFRWRFRLIMRDSVTVADAVGTHLQSFDIVHMVQIENIQTDRDRLAAIAAMERFIAELDSYDQSQRIVQDLVNLKRDIDAFVTRIAVSIEETVIAPLTSDIEALDGQIIAAYKAIGVLGGDGVLRILGLGAKASDVIASLQYHRDKKADTLREIRGAVTALKKLVAPKAIWNEGNLDKMLDDLIVFGEIWTSVRSQSVQFTEILGRGLAAATSMGFKAQVRLARDVCTPLRDGLIDYSWRIWDWLLESTPQSK